MASFVSKLGNNFLVAAFIPSLSFVILAEILFYRLDPAGIDSRWAPPSNIFEDGLTTLVVTLIIGFTLMGLNTFIYKILEGYEGFERISILKKRQYRKALKRRLAFEQRDKLADQILARLESEKDRKRKLYLGQLIGNLRQESRDLKAAYKQSYPSQIRAVLPTRFGNIFKAAEQYANENYGIDAVAAWPRLIHVIQPDYYRKLDESNNGLAFIINCMVLSVVLVILCLIASSHQFAAHHIANEEAEKLAVLWDQPQIESIDEEDHEVITFLALPLETTQDARNQYWQRAWIYLIASGLIVGVAFLFYNASLPAARQYGNLVRSSYDLFRFDLLRQLRLPLPEDDEKEYILWKNWSRFISLGELDLPKKKVRFKYDHEPATKATGSERSNEREGE